MQKDTFLIYLDTSKEDINLLFSFTTPFTIDSVGSFLDRVFSKDFDYKGEQHNFIELVYIDSGNVEVVEDEKVYRLGEGDLILHAPMEFHRIRSDADTAPHVLNLSFSVSGNLPARLFGGVFHISSVQRTALLQLHQLGIQFTMSQYLQNHPSPEDTALSTALLFPGYQIACALSALLLEICREAPLSKVHSHDHGALLYNQLVSRMEECCCQNLALEELAAYHFISVSYVKKLFRIYADMGPRHFFNQIRAREAALRLDKGYTAAEVAELMNFSSPNYFTLFFKKQTGMTPSEYKKQKMNL
jgi:AraC-like DNA-binding protein